MYKKCLVVNLIGGPGVGKSILASEVFSSLKRLGVKCDLSNEYIKRKLREKATKAVQSQIYIFGKQQFQLFTMKDDLDVIVTDSPILLNTIYDDTECPFLKGLVLKEYDKYENLLFYIDRDLSVEYETEGRYQDLSGAKDVDNKVINFLKNNQITYTLLNGIGKDSLEIVITEITKKLNEIKN